MKKASFPTMTLTLDALSCRRGERMLFENLSFTAKSGELLVLRGPNGVGKSSLMRILSGLLKAHSGQVILESEAGAYSDLAEEAHYLSHHNALKPTLSVLENLAFWRAFMARVGEPSTGFTALQALQALGVAHLLDLPCDVLSAGQKRRVAMARLLVAPRAIWLLDEPTAALDAAADKLVGACITNHVKSGGLVLAATHLPLKTDLKKEQTRTIDLSDFQPDHAFQDGFVL